MKLHGERHESRKGIIYMRGESQVEIALLVLLMAEFYSDINATSELIGESAGASPVVVRRIYGQLKRAGLLDTRPGRYGLHLAKDAHDVTLLDIVEAVHPFNSATAFGVQAPLSGACTISDNIYDVLTEELDDALSAARERLAKVTLYDLAWKLPDTYDVPVEEKLATMHKSLKEAEVRHGGKSKEIEPQFSCKL